tara:strand:- start:141 stop:2366 length:2226 start_codon:yes stop_codon:yes gene_type:complete
MQVDDLIVALRLPKNKWKKFKRILQIHLNSGKVLKVQSDRYCLPEDSNLVKGIIRFRQNGSAILYAEKKLVQYPVDLFHINPEDTQVSIHGDRIEARIINKPKRTHRYSKGKRIPLSKEDSNRVYAKVLRVLDRKHASIPGTFRKGKMYHYVAPDDPRINKDIFVLPPDKNSEIPYAEVDDKVIVKIKHWKQRDQNPEGEITQVLGKTHTPFAEYQAILHKHELDPEFPSGVVRELNLIPEEVQENDFKDRSDCRDLLTFTIDPEDAKDFDDALSIQYLPNNQVKIGIHIADVSHYVKPNSALDKEAKNRGNSTYLVGTVIPMLPKKLSNGLCSLVEGENRLTKTVFVVFNEQLEIDEVYFGNSVIKSNKRLTYQQALAFLQLESLSEIRKTPLPPSFQTGSIGKSLDRLDDSQMKELQKAIRLCWKIGARIRKRRMKHGSLDFDMPEVKIYLDEEGYADRIEKLEYDESHQLIEEFMLLANEEISREMTRANIPCVYRVHDKPDATKLDELREYLITFGVQTGNLEKRKEVLRMLKQLSDHPQGFVLKVQFLRSLRQACYRSTPDGHYGLNKKDYTHFTSPIRRYSDLVVHRMLNYYMIKVGADSRSPKIQRPYKPSDLRSLSDHLSITEQNSTEAERESHKIKQLEFFDREMNREDKNSFKAIVTDIKAHGLFVELQDLTTFGFVHVSKFKEDQYNMNSKGTALIGRKTQKSYELGQVIEVVIERVDRYKRQIDFSLFS